MMYNEHDPRKVGKEVYIYMTQYNYHTMKHGVTTTTTFTDLKKAQRFEQLCKALGYKYSKTITYKEV